MPKLIIEREIDGAGTLSSEDLQGISQKSCSVLKNLGTDIQWVESYVTDNKAYCVYIAPTEELIKKADCVRLSTRLHSCSVFYVL